MQTKKKTLWSPELLLPYSPPAAMHFNPVNWLKRTGLLLIGFTLQQITEYYIAGTMQPYKILTCLPDISDSRLTKFFIK